ncbi:MAG: hypothetical protein ACJAYU_001373 [Bradymonadia bacterium]|jgi:uncharacterized protein (TIGR02453 family)
MFSKSALNFLVDISLNNNREWFDKNRQRYEDDVREPAFAFIRAMEPHLHAVSSHFTAVPKKTGGSLMRIFRDTRFGKDKTPYKTNIGVQFRHEAGKNVHAPGFYLHMDPDEGCFLGVGIWGPDGPTIRAIREAIDENQDEYVRVRDGKAFRAKFEVTDHGASLKTAPKGFPKDHPLIVDLRMKHHIATASLDPEMELFGDAGVAHIADLMKRAADYARFLTEATGHAF